MPSAASVAPASSILPCLSTSCAGPRVCAWPRRVLDRRVRTVRMLFIRAPSRLKRARIPSTAYAVPCRCFTIRPSGYPLRLGRARPRPPARGRRAWRCHARFPGPSPLSRARGRRRRAFHTPRAARTSRRPLLSSPASARARLVRGPPPPLPSCLLSCGRRAPSRRPTGRAPCARAGDGPIDLACARLGPLRRICERSTRDAAAAGLRRLSAEPSAAGVGAAERNLAEPGERALEPWGR